MECRTNAPQWTNIFGCKGGGGVPMLTTHLFWICLSSLKSFAQFWMSLLAIESLRLRPRHWLNSSSDTYTRHSLATQGDLSTLQVQLGALATDICWTWGTPYRSSHYIVRANWVAQRSVLIWWGCDSNKNCNHLVSLSIYSSRLMRILSQPCWQKTPKHVPQPFCPSADRHMTSSLRFVGTPPASINVGYCLSQWTTYLKAIQRHYIYMYIIHAFL